MELAPQDLKLLSMPGALGFLLTVESDITHVIAATTESSSSVRVVFPPVASTFVPLIESCAARFGLGCTVLNGSVTAHGKPTVPLLRYVDFLPGGFTAEEILACVIRPQLAMPERQPDGSFAARTINYDEYATDVVFDAAGGVGYYAQLDFGLPLAAHGHLIKVILDSDEPAPSAIKALKAFAGLDQLDLRWENEQHPHVGVAVMPSAADASDLFEKYEDEESDDDEEGVPFALRPVASCGAVPFVDEPQLKRLRALHWQKTLTHWESFATNKFTCVVLNCQEKISLDELMRVFDGLSVEDALLMKDGRGASRKLYVVFKDAESCRAALDIDAKSFHGKSLRIQVAPPYALSRRGKVVCSLKSCGVAASDSRGPLVTPPVAIGGSAAPSDVKPAAEKQPVPAAIEKHVAEPPRPVAEGAPNTPSSAPHKTPKIGMNVEAKEFIPSFGRSPIASFAPPPAAPPPYAPPPRYEEALTSPQVQPLYYGNNSSARSIPPPPPYGAPPSYTSVINTVSPSIGPSPPPPPPPYSTPPAV